MSYLLFLAFFLLQALDSVTTYEILQKGGRELNPIMRFIFNRIGVIAGLSIVKASLVAAVFFLLSYVPVWAMLVLVIFSFCVVVFNVLNLKKPIKRIQNVRK